ncbi:hypothetical protein JP0186_10270 [Helicobacter pylori]
MEDLYSFNDEKIADALHLAKTFSMSAIGHESDFLLSDSVADLRASTPFLTWKSSSSSLIIPLFSRVGMQVGAGMGKCFFSLAFLSFF